MGYPSMTIQSTNVIAAVEAARINIIAQENKTCDDLLAQFAPVAAGNRSTYQKPTLDQGHDPRNKNGANLTPRGVEILFRVFDDGGGYNRAAKMLNITQAAAKNRKAMWLKVGGISRPKTLLDIDLI